MPDFNTFRINEKLIGRLYAIRKVDTYLDNININDTKHNKNIKCKTVTSTLFKTFEEWDNYIHKCSVVDLDKIK